MEISQCTHEPPCEQKEMEMKAFLVKEDAEGNLKVVAEVQTTEEENDVAKVQTTEGENEKMEV